MDHELMQMPEEVSVSPLPYWRMAAIIQQQFTPALLITDAQARVHFHSHACYPYLVTVPQPGRSWLSEVLTPTLALGAETLLQLLARQPQEGHAEVALSLPSGKLLVSARRQPMDGHDMIVLTLTPAPEELPPVRLSGDLYETAHLITDLRNTQSQLLDKLRETRQHLVQATAESTGLRQQLASDTAAGTTYEQALQAGGVGILVLDARLCIIRFTPEVCQWIPLQPDDKHRPISHFALRVEFEAFLPVLQNSLDQEKRIIHQIWSPDAGVQIIAQPWYAPDQLKPAGVTVFFLDQELYQPSGPVFKGVTTRGGLERLTEYQVRYILFETATHAIALVDTDGHIIKTNRVASQEVSWEVKGRPFWSLPAFALTVRGKRVARRQFETAWNHHELVYEDVHMEQDQVIRACAVTLRPVTIQGIGLVMLAESRDTTSAVSARENLRSRENLYRLIPRSMSDSGILIFSRDLRFLLAEGPLLLAMNFPTENVEGKTLYEVLPPDAAERLAVQYQRVLDGASFHFESEWKGMIYSAQMDPLYNKQGEIYAGLIVAKDITHLRKVHHAIEFISQSTSVPSEKQFFENLAQSLAQILNVSHVFVGEYREATSMVETTAYWRKGEHVPEFRYEMNGTPSQQIIKARTQLFVQAGARHQYPADDYLEEYQIEGYIGTPLFNSAKEVIGLLVVMHDGPFDNYSLLQAVIQVFTTRAGAELERRRAQRALVASEFVYKTIAANIGGGLVALCRESGNMIFCEGDCLPQLGMEGGIPPGFNLLTAQADTYPFWSQITAQVRNTFAGLAAREEIRIEKRTYLANFIPVPGMEGEEALSLIIIQDISQLKEVENFLAGKLSELAEKNLELERYINSNLELERFAYVASHDLLEPVRTIRSFAQLMGPKPAVAQDEELQEYLDFIIKASDRMRRLIQDLLEYSKITYQNTATREDFGKVSLPILLSGVIGNLDNLIHEHEVSLRIGDMPPWIYGSEVKLVQVFQNLIANAIKFRRKDIPCEISVTARAETNHIEFVIQDNGIGIDTQYLEKVFLPFRKLHSQQEYEGSGIGLALCQRVIEQHGGRIWVESTLGEGSRFYIRLPWEAY
ncbi:MAG: ATP-binding protein [Bacteroidia bacterium]|nr:ATP-binding protein [Bacteroidia bacterium]